ncbi:PaaI family thioesterase [Naasia lichenicola]|uniref:PaaI family thioesterase n=1 Tax=Naasia lichenicola TaxID=2565933 RepID=A0A4S4FRP2_9MICO|nr:PaaI family thioesterase [Naasia lichenicola]THG32345.1 PaaI family thioesterase [Naasia lichenicola]
MSGGLADEVAPGATGLEQLQALLAAGRMPGIGTSLQFTLTEIDTGRAVFEGTPGEHAYNPIGSVHGGYAASLLDSACGCAVHSTLSAAEAYTTVELKISYVRGMTKDTGPVRAEAVVVNRGRRVAFAEAKLTDATGRLLATASSTLLIIER